MLFWVLSQHQAHHHRREYLKSHIFLIIQLHSIVYVCMYEYILAFLNVTDDVRFPVTILLSPSTILLLSMSLRPFIRLRTSSLPSSLWRQLQHFFDRSLFPTDLHFNLVPVTFSPTSFSRHTNQCANIFCVQFYIIQLVPVALHMIMHVVCVCSTHQLIIYL